MMEIDYVKALKRGMLSEKDPSVKKVPVRGTTERESRIELQLLHEEEPAQECRQQPKRQKKEGTTYYPHNGKNNTGFKAPRANKLSLT